MSKKSLILYSTLSLIIGLFILPAILNWLGLPSGSDVLAFIFGEPNVINRIVVALIGIILLFLVTRGFYKEYKKAS
ncbi:hypothetical protein CIL05_14925 [Virgibacillus profundi]|uniref:Uncharacterized protein n=1 Tax=Virgibacillus profundi TaxID=2024555 RepID=A0A2A2ICB4_9BACI|nr:hypothetical protein [Virgibacillus profundi]PAV28914.1 hypothetical protein CIL05_14925 [Virgibacillus profundi]PXY53082.1 hypothetical protein CIT14_15050 [Virgibacillus profundi]